MQTRSRIYVQHQLHTRHKLWPRMMTAVRAPYQAEGGDGDNEGHVEYCNFDDDGNDDDDDDDDDDRRRAGASARAYGYRCARDAGLSLGNVMRAMLACAEMCVCAYTDVGWV